MGNFRSPEESVSMPIAPRLKGNKGGYPADAIPSENTVENDVFVAHAPMASQTEDCTPDPRQRCHYELVSSFRINEDGEFDTTIVSEANETNRVGSQAVIADFMKNTDPEDVPDSEIKIHPAICLQCRRSARAAMLKRERGES